MPSKSHFVCLTHMNINFCESRLLNHTIFVVGWHFLVNIAHGCRLRFMCTSIGVLLTLLRWLTPWFFSQILQRNTEYVNAVEAAQVKTISNDLLVPHGVVFWGGWTQVTSGGQIQVELCVKAKAMARLQQQLQSFSSEPAEFHYHPTLKESNWKSRVCLWRKLW